MSSRDLASLGEVEDRPPLRNGRSRRRSPLNSTVSVQANINGAAGSDLSAIQPYVHDDLGSACDSYRESPVGFGAGTSLSRSARNSVEYFSDPDHIEQEFVSFNSLIDQYESGHEEKIDWMESIVPDHTRIKERLENFQSRLVLSNQLNYFDRVNLLGSRLDRVKRILLSKMVEFKNRELHCEGDADGVTDSTGGTEITVTHDPNNLPVVIEYLPSNQIEDAQVEDDLGAAPLTEVDTQEVQIFLLDDGVSDSNVTGNTTLPRVMKDVIEATNKNIKLTNEKYQQISNFQKETERLLKDLTSKTDVMNKFMSDSQTRFNNLAQTVAEVGTEQGKLITQVAQVVNDANDNCKTLTDRISNQVTTIAQLTDQNAY